MHLTRKFEFDAAHSLEGLHQKEKQLHGHRYVLEVSIVGKIQDGIVMDIEIIKEIVQKEVIEKLDHNYLNNIIPHPTAEHISLWIWKALESKLPLYEIKLYETPNNWVAYKGD